MSVCVGIEFELLQTEFVCRFYALKMHKNRIVSCSRCLFIHTCNPKNRWVWLFITTNIEPLSGFVFVTKSAQRTFAAISFLSSWPFCLIARHNLKSPKPSSHLPWNQLHFISKMTFKLSNLQRDITCCQSLPKRVSSRYLLKTTTCSYLNCISNKKRLAISPWTWPAPPSPIATRRRSLPLVPPLARVSSALMPRIVCFFVTSARAVAVGALHAHVKVICAKKYAHIFSKYMFLFWICVEI